MIWLAMVFVVGTIAYWIILKPMHKIQDWLVQFGLLGLAVVMAIIVQSDLWPELDPLWPIKVVFMPLSEWLYNHV